MQSWKEGQSESVKQISASESGFTQEFFIEGGRSRSGKMLSPKVGLLATYVDAMADRIVPDIQFVPVYIAYERVVEDYTTEVWAAVSIAVDDQVPALVAGRWEGVVNA